MTTILTPERNKKRKRRQNDESDKDRLSDLPDCVLLYIFSFLKNPKDIIRTCILSTRWKHLWKRGFPILTLHETNFSNYNNFDRFVCKILRFRDNSTLLHTFDLERRGSTDPSYEMEYDNSTYLSYEREYVNSIPPRILRKIASYILSHTNHLCRLAISLKGDISLVLPCVSACRALTSLKLSLYPKGHSYSKKILFPKSLTFPALTSLDLTNFEFCADENNKIEPFSAFNRLNSLIICKCAIRGEINTMISILSETLVTLSLIRNCYSFTKVELSTPSLSNITFIGGLTGRLILCGSTLSSVKQVYVEVNIDSPREESVIDSLLKLPDITSLTLTEVTLGLISKKLPGVLNKLEFSSLCHLKSLKLKTNRFQESEKLLLESFKSWKEDTIETNFFRRMGRIIGFLCQNSPLAKFDLVYDV